MSVLVKENLEDLCKLAIADCNLTHGTHKDPSLQQSLEIAMTSARQSGNWIQVRDLLHYYLNAKRGNKR